MSQKQKTYLITGGNRGLGLGITRELLHHGASIFVTTRQKEPNSELMHLVEKHGKNLKVFLADVNNQTSVEKLSSELKGQTIDVLVNNAGIFLPDTHENGRFNWENIEKTFVTNTIGPMRVTEALMPQLGHSASPMVVTLSSLMGSITDNTSGGYYGYRMSKSAVNMWNRSFAKDHKNIVSVVIHPGWVQTDMGGQNAPLVVDEACKGIVNVMMNLKPQQSGEFIDYKGRTIPW